MKYRGIRRQLDHTTGYTYAAEFTSCMEYLCY